MSLGTKVSPGPGGRRWRRFGGAALLVAALVLVNGVAGSPPGSGRESPVSGDRPRGPAASVPVKGAPPSVPVGVPPHALPVPPAPIFLPAPPPYVAPLGVP